MSINNFRGIKGGLESNTLNFDNTNAIFIFGQNNVGKSSYLKSYVAFYNDSVKESDFTNNSTEDIVIEASFIVDETHERKIIDEGTSNKFDHIKENYLDKHGVLRLRKTWLQSDKGKKSKNETYNIVTEAWEDKSYAGIGFSSVFKPLLMKPLFINAMPTEQDVQTVVSEVLKEIATSNLSSEKSIKFNQAIKTISDLQDEIYSKTDIDTYKREVNDQFKTLFNGFEIDIDEGTSRMKFTQDKVGKDFKVSFKDVDKYDNTYEQMGHGAIRMAIFLLMLMRDKLKGEARVSKSFLVLFEEPELFLHPALTKKLRSLVYQVSGDDMPFQILCASHSPQMIDISKEHTSLVRMTKNITGDTVLFQIKKQDLINEEQTTDAAVKQKIYEILRFDPFICETFYADEVLLVEGDTEAIISRGYQQEFESSKDVFVVNCHSVVNIPFYQKIFSKFNIPYSVICDTDHISNGTGWDEKIERPQFEAQIQRSISEQFEKDYVIGKAKYFYVFPETFEPYHESLKGKFKFDTTGPEGKPFKANRYWNEIVKYKDQAGFYDVPIVKYLQKIIDSGDKN
jgi:putative ATP-dependent endonuclease of OLD family